MDNIWLAWRARAIENMERNMKSPARQVVRLFDEGKTPPQIASILNLDEDLVHRFLESRRPPQPREEPTMPTIEAIIAQWEDLYRNSFTICLPRTEWNVLIARLRELEAGTAAAQTAIRAERSHSLVQFEEAMEVLRAVVDALPPAPATEGTQEACAGTET